jgi:hypothetical protein
VLSPSGRGADESVSGLTEGPHASRFAVLVPHQATAELVRDGSRWLIRRMRIENAWYTGDPIAIFGG